MEVEEEEEDDDEEEEGQVSHLEGAEAELEEDLDVPHGGAAGLHQVDKHHVVDPKQRDEQQRGLGQASAHTQVQVQVGIVLLLVVVLVGAKVILIVISKHHVPVLRAFAPSNTSAAQLLHQDADDADEEDEVDLLEKEQKHTQIKLSPDCSCT